MSQSKAYSSGLSLDIVLLIIFITLKLTGNIDWSWWWVTSPLWLPVAVILIAALLTVSIVSIGVFTRKRKRKMVGTFYKKN